MATSDCKYAKESGITRGPGADQSESNAGCDSGRGSLAADDGLNDGVEARDAKPVPPPQELEASHLLANRMDVMHDILQFIPEDVYLFVGSVCKTWRLLWREAGRSNSTCVRRVAESPETLAWALTQRDFKLVASRGGTMSTVVGVGNIDSCSVAATLLDNERWKSGQHGRRLMSYAAAAGHLEILKWAKEQGCGWNAYTCSEAAKGGHLHVLQWARDKGCAWNALTCIHAARGGHLEMLKWAVAQGCPFDKVPCSRKAAEGGHIETLKWIKSQRCPFDEEICSSAALGGHLHVLQWARDGGCPWNAKTCRNAAARGHLETVKWARENGCPWDAETSAAAATGGFLDTMKWVRANGCPWDRRTRCNAQNGRYTDILEWLDEERCP